MHSTLLLFITSLLSLIHPTQSTNHDIAVGPSLSFTPNTTNASPNDTLTFHFYPGRHNVAQSSFSTPCIPSNNGFYSGFIVPSGSGPDPETFVVTVNDTEPIWFYCSEYMHCQLGMVGVINPPAGTTGETLEAYALAASKTTNSTTPAEVAGGVFSSSPASISAPTSTPTSTSTSASEGAGTSTSSSSPTQTQTSGAMTGGNMFLHGMSAVLALAAVWAGCI